MLHTWGQTLCEHYHLHLIVTGGGLSLCGDEWVDSQPGQRGGRWLFSTRALGEVFRARYLEGLRRSYDNEELEFHGAVAHWGEEGAFARQLRHWSRRKWNVYAKAPFGGPQQVLRYLSLYTHRVAISGGRVLEVDRRRESVRFTYKDYADGDKRKEMTLTAAEFTRRFAQHILPRGFCKIRHYGILSTRNRGEKVAMCRVLMGAVPPEEAFPGTGPFAPVPGQPPLPDAETPPEEAGPTGLGRCRCPACGSQNLAWHNLLGSDSRAGSQRAPPPPGAAEPPQTMTPLKARR